MVNEDEMCHDLKMMQVSGEGGWAGQSRSGDAGKDGAQPRGEGD